MFFYKEEMPSGKRRSTFIIIQFPTYATSGEIYSSDSLWEQLIPKDALDIIPWFEGRPLERHESCDSLHLTHGGVISLKSAFDCDDETNKVDSKHNHTNNFDQNIFEISEEILQMMEAGC